MSTARRPWHVDFALFMKQIAPRGVEVTFELTIERQRGDLLLLRREDVPRRDANAKAFLGLWPLLRTDTLVDFKNVAWPPAKGDLARLQGYGAHYFAARVERPLALPDLALVLVLPTRTPTLVTELARMEWTVTPLGNGYERIDGSGFHLYLAVMAEIAEAEDDSLLGLFCGHKLTPKQITWWQSRARALEDANLQDMPGSDEIIQQVLDSLPVEQRLAGLTLEQRLTGLAPEWQVLALSDDVLRGLQSECLSALPAEIREAIHRRLGTKSLT